VLILKHRKISNKQRNATQVLEKQEQATPKTSRREIIKVMVEINEIESKEKHTKNQ
jgi:hypothetical protein